MDSRAWGGYWTSGINTVEGWVGDGLRTPLELIDSIQRDLGVDGAILEIGVHHGKFFIPLALLSNPERESCVAMDIFDQQYKNMDGSGCGSMDVFLANVDRHCPGRRVCTIRTDSLSFTSRDRAKFQEDYGSVRLASIDGGHTVVHTVNDLQIVQDMLANGGVVILDDYYNSHWPGVHEGFARFFLLGTPRIRPFCCTSNKIFLTDWTHHQRFLAPFLDRFRDAANFKEVTMYGTSVAVF